MDELKEYIKILRGQGKESGMFSLNEVETLIQRLEESIQREDDLCGVIDNMMAAQ